MSPVFNQQELLDRVDQDWEFLTELVQLLASDGRGLVDQISAAAASGDTETVSRAAHTIKGMVSNFCAPTAQEAALAVEKAVKGGDLSTLPAAVTTLRNDVEELISGLTELLATRT